jgi:hypothetical protein
LARKTAFKVSARCASRAVAWPLWTASGVMKPMPEWRCSPLYQAKS